MLRHLRMRQLTATPPFLFKFFCSSADFVRGSPGHEYPGDQLRLVVDIDLNGAFYFTKALVAYWLKQEPRLIRDDTDYGLGKVSFRKTHAWHLLNEVPAFRSTRGVHSST